MNWRKWNKIIHRDLGYIFFGMTIIYAVSGIAINHINDWNPNYDVTRVEIEVELPAKKDINKDVALNILKKVGEEKNYKKFYFPTDSTLKIFLKSGSVTAPLSGDKAIFEKLERRPILHQFNYLHYNPGNWWTWFADIFCVALILLAFSGLFIIRGKKGITGRGAWLTSAGIIIPIIYLIMFYK